MKMQRTDFPIRGGPFMNMNESYYVDKDKSGQALEIAEEIQKTGVKNIDALHVACAILAGKQLFYHYR